MPGRQAHGRSLTAAAKPKPISKKSKSRAQKNALNAFNIAQEHFPSKQKRTPRARELDADIERKHARDEDDDDDEEEEEREPKRKKIKARSGDDGVEYGSDSEGHEWQLGGMAEDDEDSEIESDEAFGESDDEMFQGYAFRGSNSKHNGNEEDDSDDGNDDLGETLGEDAIDLATALDQFEEESEGPEEAEAEEEEEDADSGSDEADESEDADDESDEEADPERLKQLQGLISGFGGEDGDIKDASATKQKISLSDLGLTGLSDPHMKRSLKLLKKEEGEARPGASKKLDVPLSRREQGRLDRGAAYDKTKETLERWTETVKANRRAEHLVFPLAQNSESLGVDRTEMQLLSAKGASNELESTIMSIMEASGLSMEKKEKPREVVYDEEGNALSRRQALVRKRMERELNSREAQRAKRIKKIKSKAYHRVHRKQRERDEQALADAGEVDSEEEREAHDRRRALERVGQRHKESKWAKLGSSAKRAVWDDDFRAGLTEMARKDEELRRRKEGKGVQRSDDEESSSGSDNEDDLRRQLDRLDEQAEEGPASGLMKMKFMQKAEAAKKKANDELIQQIRKQLDGEEGGDSEDSEEEEEVVARRQYGDPSAPAKPRKAKPDAPVKQSLDSPPRLARPSAPAQTPAETTSSLAGAWSRDAPRRKKTTAPTLDLASNTLLASKPNSSPPPNSKQPEEGVEDDSDADIHPLALQADQDLISRAFAGEDIVTSFAQEKEDAVAADGDKIMDNTLPGWGSWVGEGVSERERKRHHGRFLTKVEGVKRGDRRDAKLDKVIINEKRVKKNDRFLAPQLPHQFESPQQYERSLRLPVGPEWMTKESFQDSTKPRVLIKQGIIAPMSRPTH